MRVITTQVGFNWDDGVETQIAKLHVPDKYGWEDIANEIEKTHNYLDLEDEEDIYGTQGRNSETLLNYLCETHKDEGWQWEPLDIDVDMELD